MESTTVFHIANVSQFFLPSCCLGPCAKPLFHSFHNSLVSIQGLVLGVIWSPGLVGGRVLVQ